MSQDIASEEAPRSLVGKLLLGAVGLVVVPLAIAFQGKTFLHQLRNFNFGGLAAPDERHRVSLRVIDGTAQDARRKDAIEIIEDLLEDGDWLSLGELVQEWDEGRVHAGGDQSLATLAMEIVIGALSDGHYAPNYCTPIAIPAIRESAFRKVARLRESHPELPFFAILEGYLHLMKAWENRGTGPSAETTEAGMADALRRADQSRWVVAPILEAQYSSALLAQLRVGWLAFGCEGLGEFRKAFDLCREADRKSSYADRWMGNFLLPRWYGEGPFEPELRAECERLGGHGPAAYVRAILQVKDMEAGILPEIEPEYFAQGLRDLGALHSDDQAYLNRLLAAVVSIATDEETPMFNKQAKARWQAMIDGIYAGATDVLLSHVTALDRRAFPDEAPFLDLISDALPQAFASGAHFVLDEAGLRAVRGESV